MKHFFTLLFVLIITSIVFSQNYKQVRIYFNNPNDAHLLQQAELEFDHFEMEKDNSIITFISDSDFLKLRSTSLKYDVLIDDWFDYYEKLPVLSSQEKSDFIFQSKQNFNVEGFGFGSMGGYYTLTEIYERLDSMYLLYPNIITQKFQIGTTIENRPIYAVKISDNPNIAENEPQVFYNSLIHAREPAAMMAVIYYMYYLLENYGTDPEVTYLVNNREIYFVPAVNPDGYEHNRSTNPNGGGMWRKNRRNNGTSFGVDLNRNFGFQWGYNNTGSSSNPSSETYRGTAPFSEPETQAFRDFCNTKSFKTALNYHTYSNLLLYPWGYINQPTPDNDIFIEYAADMTRFNNYTIGQPPTILYDVNGATDDWMYGEQVTKPKILSLTPEVGSSSDGFWPPQTRIFPLAQENLWPNLYYTWVAGAYVGLLNAGFSQQYFNPGDVVTMNSTFRNKGLSDSENIEVQLTSLSPYLTVNNGTASFASIPARGTAAVSTPFSFTVSSSAPVDVEASLLVTISSDNVVMNSDTLKLYLGTPIFVFADTTNNPLNYWTVTFTPSSSPKWEATSQTFYSSPVSYTDSKDGNYVNNATITMTLTDPIDLSGLNNPRLTFWTKFDIEDNWDYGQVRISTNNGSTWVPLAGQYTEPGTGSFQPNGQPVYDGVQSNWVREDLLLTGYTASQVKIQYQLRTDGSVTRDGWYLDDIGIIYYGIIPVELSSFSASYSDNKVLLKWITASELNNHRFEVQRSVFNEKTADNREWRTMGFIEGNGTTASINNYSFVDSEPLTGKSYYRLKQIDFDGTFSYVNEVEVDYHGVTEYSLEQNYPNPFNPTTTINYQLSKSADVTIKVYNILGVEVASLVNGLQTAGKHKVEFNAQDLSSGIYFYTIKTEEFTQTRKMLFLK
ncbi:MAG TPA: M14 family zinc carboxypeptidase [Ignavibacteriaceae bacterium]|nr:M14 family zinc carboxypeptidase [Ignavibacteriaceae bacterium]